MLDLYEAAILDHSRTPRCYGALHDATAEAENLNRLCGDSVRVFVRLCGDDFRIEEMRFTGRSCAIATASASLLSVLAVGKMPSDLHTLAVEFEQFLRSEREQLSAPMQSFQVFAGVRAAPSRIKCALLSWNALQAALHKASQ